MDGGIVRRERGPQDPLDIFSCAEERGTSERVVKMKMGMND